MRDQLDVSKKVVRPVTKDQASGGSHSLRFDADDMRILTVMEEQVCYCMMVLAKVSRCAQILSVEHLP